MLPVHPARAAVLPCRGCLTTTGGERQAGQMPKEAKLTKLQNKRRERAPRTPEVFREIKRRLAEGHLQHDIAADLGWNQGRIADVKAGRLGGEDVQRSLF